MLFKSLLERSQLRYAITGKVAGDIGPDGPRRSEEKKYECGFAVELLIHCNPDNFKQETCDKQGDRKMDDHWMNIGKIWHNFFLSYHDRCGSGWEKSALRSREEYEEYGEASYFMVI